MSSLELYYPVLEATFLATSVIVHIPVRSSVTFALFQIIPFPFFYNGSIYQVSVTSDFFLLSHDHRSVALASSENIAECSSLLPDSLLCPAYLFSIFSSASAPCESALVRNLSVLSACSYVPVPRRPVYHVHLSHVQYLFFPTSTVVSIICPDHTRSVSARGLYKAPDHCTIKSDYLTTYPTRHHLAVRNHTFDIFQPINVSFDLSPGNLSIIPPSLPFLDFLNGTDFVANQFSLALDASWVQPVYVFPPVFLCFIGVIIALVLIICFVRRVDNRLHEIRVAAGLLPDTNHA